LGLAGSASGGPYNPHFLVNAGFGYFAPGRNAIEVSEWINVTKLFLDRSAGIAKAYWLGFDQGYYLSGRGRIGYLEVQAARMPGGISAGLIWNRSGSPDWKGSVWLSAPFIVNFTGAAGFETSREGKKPGLSLGLFIKVPVFACCNVLGPP
jgi:hypothetical protein